MFQPVITNKLALIRMLRRFAKELGLSDHMGDAAAQVFLHRESGLGRWDAWMRNNCAGCRFVIGEEGCTMLAPPDDQIPSSLNRDQFLSGQILAIESGRLPKCPRFQGRE